MSAKNAVILALLVFGAILAYQVGSRMSDQAVQVVVGVVCGIAASIPVSLGLLIALTRTRRRDGEEFEEDPYRGAARYPQPSRPPYPPVIVVAPPQTQFPNPYAGFLPPGNMNEPPQMRDFRIVGDEDDELDA